MIAYLPMCDFGEHPPHSETPADPTGLLGDDYVAQDVPALWGPFVHFFEDVSWFTDTFSDES